MSRLCMAAAAALLGAVAGCGEGSIPGASGSAEATSGGSVGGQGTAAAAGSHGVTQAGAQDFGLFRQVLDAGKVPAPNVLDDLGFFAEHKLDYPKATCGQDLCMHGLVGSMGNMITGANCTIVQIGLNTPLDAATLPRPPLDLVIAIDVSGSMQGEPIDFVREGLKRMLDYLDKEDRLSLVVFSDSADALFQGVGIDQKTKLAGLIGQIQTSGQTNLYDGLFTAYQIAAKQQGKGRSARVLFLSDGAANVGLQVRAKLRALAKAYALQGIGLSTIGVGKEFDVEAMRDVAEAGAGNFYFLEQPKAAAEVFTDEVKTAFHALALDAKITFRPAKGYAIRGVYGTHGWVGGPLGGVISIPALYLAKRTDATASITEGRRGGGGAILIELIPLAGVPDKAIGQLEIQWRHPVTGKVDGQVAALVAPHAPGQAPPEGWFSAPTVEKGFVMLNLFAAFQMACAQAFDADAGAARGVLQALKPQVTKWLKVRADPDVADDMKYVDKFLDALVKLSAQTPIQVPADPWPAD